MLNQIRQFIKSNEKEIILLLGVAIVSLVSFTAGRITSFSKDPIKIQYLEASLFSKDNTEGESAQEVNINNSGVYVASKNSTKYHLPECTGAQRIAEHNKIWFNSKEEAESTGYTPAANCPGL